jgi:hypothetical protein
MELIRNLSLHLHFSTLCSVTYLRPSLSQPDNLIQVVSDMSIQTPPQIPGFYNPNIVFVSYKGSGGNLNIVEFITFLSAVFSFSPKPMNKVFKNLKSFDVKRQKIQYFFYRNLGSNGNHINFFTKDNTSKLIFRKIISHLSSRLRKLCINCGSSKLRLYDS